MSTGSRNRWRRSGARKKWAINAFPRRQTKAESRRPHPRRNHTAASTPTGKAVLAVGMSVDLALSLGGLV